LLNALKLEINEFKSINSYEKIFHLYKLKLKKMLINQKRKSNYGSLEIYKKDNFKKIKEDKIFQDIKEWFYSKEITKHLMHYLF